MTTTERQALPRFDSGIPPPAELYSRVRAAIDATPAARVSTRTRIIIALAVIPCVVGIALALASQIVYQRQAVGLDVSAPSSGQLLLALSLLVALALAATFVALRRRRMGSGIAPLLLAVGLVAPVYAVLTLVNPLHAHDPFPPPVVLSPWGARCITLAAIVGGLVLATFVGALRRAVPIASGWRGAALGAAAGAWAGLAVFVFCPASDLQHLLAGHVLPVAALTAIGIVGIPRALRP